VHKISVTGKSVSNPRGLSLGEILAAGLLFFCDEKRILQLRELQVAFPSGNRPLREWPFGRKSGVPEG
jgi:hypothetical protein